MTDDEQAWRTRSLDLLSSAHALGGVLELSFEVVESTFGDLAFQLECNAFKWRWETISVGHKISANILSKHLIIPLISVNHLAFSSLDAVGNLPPIDLEQTIDKVARTARRTVDTHVKNALSRPRLATTIRRITAVFNFIPDPPIVTTDAHSPVLLLPPESTPKIKKSPKRLKGTHTPTPERNDRRDVSTSSKRDSVALSRRSSPINHAADSGSATEPEDDPLVQPSRPTPGSGADQQPDIRMRSPTPSREALLHTGATRSRSVTKAPPSDTDPSPVRPIKKSKLRVASSDEDSEEERKKLAAQIKRGDDLCPRNEAAHQAWGKTVLKLSDDHLSFCPE
ncbi:hypothetical protein J3R83DRAFT_11908 [Lanmaoa asiatica]|nr:hypothetical protein J3R83DRAFT_11908 [Lanmaoa asiatica]